MKQNLYTIHDRVANIYEPPVASHNEATIMRWFVRCIDSVPTMKSNPQDFALYCVGEVDTSTGLIDARESLQFVCTALDCINNIQEESANVPQPEETQISDDPSIQSGSEG